MADANTRGPRHSINPAMTSRIEPAGQFHEPLDHNAGSGVGRDPLVGRSTVDEAAQAAPHPGVGAAGTSSDGAGTSGVETVRRLIANLQAGMADAARPDDDLDAEAAGPAGPLESQSAPRRLFELPLAFIKRDRTLGFRRPTLDSAAMVDPKRGDTAASPVMSLHTGDGLLWVSQAHDKHPDGSDPPGARRQGGAAGRSLLRGPWSVPVLPVRMPRRAARDPRRSSAGARISTSIGTHEPGTSAGTAHIVPRQGERGGYGSSTEDRATGR